MNIWVLDKDPIKSGQILKKLSPVRANKMCVEFLQASAVLAEDLRLPPILKKDGTPYKTALARRFPKPLMDWLRESNENYYWVWMMCNSINCEFDNNNIIAMYWICDILPFKKRTPFINYAKNKIKGLDFTSEKDVVKAYHKYLKVQL